MGPYLGCGDALCASGCSFSYRCRARVSLVMTHGYQPVTDYIASGPFEESYGLFVKPLQ